MTPFRFIHCSDLHIDSPFKGLGQVRPELAKRLRRATETAWENIVSLALQEKVDAVLIAGDIFDGADRSLRAQFKFRHGLERLSAAGIPSFIVCGNHDPLESWSRSLTLPESVKVFEGDRVSRAPVLKDGVALAQVYGISFPRRDVRDNLVPLFQREAKDGFAIGLLHTNVGGDANHDNYAPCTVEDLAATGFDYWALGHIHSHQILRSASPAIVYTGNTQARHFRETGPRGCCLVTLRPQAEPEIRFLPVDAARFSQATVDATDLPDLDSLSQRLEQQLEEWMRQAGGRILAVRLKLTGRTSLHPMLSEENALGDLAEELIERMGRDQLLLELERDTRGLYDLERLKGGQDFTADLLAHYEMALQQPDDELIRTLDPLFKSWKGRGLLEDLKPDEMRALIEQARELTLDQLLEES